MRIFVSYRFTGEDSAELDRNIKTICSGLKEAGHEVFCTYWESKSGFFKENNYSNKKLLEYAFRELDRADLVFTFVNSETKSEGMLIEFGYALVKKKKVVLFIRKGIETTFLREMADKVIEFEDIKEIEKVGV